jgi:hypothetical protein
MYCLNNRKKTVTVKSKVFMVVTAKNMLFYNVTLRSVVKCTNVSGKPPAVIIRLDE